jgi:Polyketide cyclase / dehydrase and lipid transport
MMDLSPFTSPLTLLWIVIRIVLFLAVLAGAVWFCRLSFMRPYWRSTAWATLSVVIASIFCVLVYILLARFNQEQYGLFSIILAPIACGFLFTSLLNFPALKAGKENAPWSIQRFFLDGLLAPTLLSLGHCILLFVLFLEGSICVLMAMPFLLMFYALGGALAAGTLWLLDWNQRRMLSCSAMLLAVAIIGQPLENQFLSRKEYYSQTSVIEVNAPPQEVFKLIPGFPKIADDEANPRLDAAWFQLGLPEPQQSTVNCEGVGCERRCQFNQNIHFKEKITAYEPGKLLQFDVVSVVGHQNKITGVDPHILPGGLYFDNTKGEFKLTEVRPGVTRIEGTTWYHLQSSVNWYAKPYADVMLEAIHMRVLEHIKRLAEAKKQSAAS